MYSIFYCQIKKLSRLGIFLLHHVKHAKDRGIFYITNKNANFVCRKFTFWDRQRKKKKEVLEYFPPFFFMLKYYSKEIEFLLDDWVHKDIRIIQTNN